MTLPCGACHPSTGRLLAAHRAQRVVLRLAVLASGPRPTPARCRSTQTSSTHSSAGGSCATRSPSRPTTHFLFPRLGQRRRDGLIPTRGRTAVDRRGDEDRPTDHARGRRAGRAGAPVRAQAHILAALHDGAEGGAFDAGADHGATLRRRRRRYVHHDDHELAAEHRRIERLQRRPARPPRGASAGASRRHGCVRGGRSSRGCEAGRATLHRRRQGRNQAHLALCSGSCPRGQVSGRNPCQARTAEPAGKSSSARSG